MKEMGSGRCMTGIHAQASVLFALILLLTAGECGLHPSTSSLFGGDTITVVGREVEEWIANAYLNATTPFSVYVDRVGEGEGSYVNATSFAFTSPRSLLVGPFSIGVVSPLLNASFPNYTLNYEVTISRHIISSELSADRIQVFGLPYTVDDLLLNSFECVYRLASDPSQLEVVGGATVALPASSDASLRNTVLTCARVTLTPLFAGMHEGSIVAELHINGFHSSSSDGASGIVAVQLNTSHLVRVYASPSFTSTLPAYTLAGGGAVISITSSNAFFNASQHGQEWMCEAGGAQPQNAYLISSYVLGCPTPVNPPAVLNTGVVSLPITLYLNGSTTLHSTSTLSISYVAVTEATPLSRLAPPDSITQPDVDITLTGKGLTMLAGAVSVRCLFSEVGGSEEKAVSGTLTSSSSPFITCRAPTDLSGAFRLYVSVEKSVGVFQSETSTEIIFTFHPPLTLTGVYPASGPDTGETVVTIFGQDIPRSSRVECRFRSLVDNDRNEIDGHFVNDTAIMCESLKSFGGEGSYEVSVSLNSIESSTSTTGTWRYYVYNPPIIDAVTPTLSPRIGGEAIIVKGVYPPALDATFASMGTLGSADQQDHYSQMRCSFGGHIVAASRSTSNINDITCVFPYLDSAVDNLEVEISLNSQQYTSGSEKYILGYEPVQIASLHPKGTPRNVAAYVTVVGYNFRNISSTLCKFDDVEMANLFVNEHWIICQARSRSDDGPANVSVSLNSKSFSYSPYSFTYYPNGDCPNDCSGKGTCLPDRSCQCRMGFRGSDCSIGPAVLTVSPSSARNDTNTSIIVEGFFFGYASDGVVSSDPSAPSTLTFCSFAPLLDGGGVSETENVTVNGRYVDYTISKSYSRFHGVILCTVPAGMEVGKYAVEVSVNGGVDFTSDSITLEVFSSSDVHDVYPQLGPSKGGTVVEVRGENFRPTSNMMCTFGHQLSPNVTFVSSSLLLCVAPQVEVDRSSVLSSTLPLLDYPLQLRIPSPLDEKGGGEDWVGREGRGGADVGGYVVGSGHSVAVRVSLNGQDFSSNIDHLYFYYDEPSLHSISPTFVEAGGRAEATLTGAGFFNAVYLLQATSYKEDELNVDALTLPTTFVTPLIGSGIENEEESDMLGINITAKCIFDALVVPAAVLNSSIAVCPVPPLSLPSTSAIHIAEVRAEWNDQQYSEDSLSIAYVKGAIVNSTVPSLGPIRGGTVVTLYGENFKNTTALSCRFAGSIFVSATFISSEVVECVTPSFSIPNADEVIEENYVCRTFTLDPSTDGLVCIVNKTVQVLDPSFYNSSVPLRTVKVPIQVSINRQEFAEHYLTSFIGEDIPFLFEYYYNPSVSTASPSTSALSGGATVIVTGVAMRPSNFVSCKFGEVLSPQAWYISTTSVACVSPPFNASQLVGISISLNQQQFTPTSASFLYLPLWNVTGVQPSAVPLSGGVEITVEGGTFAHTPEIACVFGRKWKSPLTSFLSPTQLKCVVPTFDEMMTTTVEVTLNGQEVSTSNVTFEVYGGTAVDGWGQNDLLQLGITYANTSEGGGGVEMGYNQTSMLVQKTTERVSDYTEYTYLLQPKLAESVMSEPVVLSSLRRRNVTRIEAGSDFTLAIASLVYGDAKGKTPSPGHLFGWGTNKFGQLGMGDKLPRREPSLIPLPRDEGEEIVDVCAGYRHSVVVLSSGRVYTWGWNNKGQLCRGSVGTTSTTFVTDELLAELASPGLVPTPLLSPAQAGDAGRDKLDPSVEGKVVGCSAGFAFTTLRTQSGKVFGCGQNDKGQIGVVLTSTTASSTTTTSFATSTTPSAGVVEIGGGKGTYTSLPVFLAGLDDYMVMTVASGYHHSLAIVDDGKVVAWGSNSRGQLGADLPVLVKNETMYTPTPQYVVGLSTRVDEDNAGPTDDAVSDPTVWKVACGAFHSAALTEEYVVYTWGRNNYGQLGLGEKGIINVEELRPYYRTVPVAVSAPSSYFFDVSLGEWHSTALAVKNRPTGWNGTDVISPVVYAWGRNAEGQLGVGHGDDVLSPTPITQKLKQDTFLISAGGRQTFSVSFCPTSPFVKLEIENQFNIPAEEKAAAVRSISKVSSSYALVSDHTSLPFDVEGSIPPRIPCAGHGQCMTSGECDCGEGWRARDCSVECLGGGDNPCSGHGTCLWDADDPRYLPESHPTRSLNEWYLVEPNRAIVIADNSTGLCRCYRGYQQSDCSVECSGGASNPCSGHGVCLVDGACLCDLGYTSSTCGIECLGGVANPCSGHGECLQDGSCDCVFGYRGNDCSIACVGVESNNICSNNGVCEEDGSCNCTAGYRGVNCQLECPGGHLNPCSGHGDESGGVQEGCLLSTSSGGVETVSCICKAGYRAADCSIECAGGADNICSGHGTCLADGSCVCDPLVVTSESTRTIDEYNGSGWRGSNCSIECGGGAESPCSGRGTCSYNGTCSCGEDGADLDTLPQSVFTYLIQLRGFRGDGCEIECKKSDVRGEPCNGDAGVCDAFGNCTCNRGRKGEACEIECNGGEDSPCTNRAENGVDCNEDGTCTCQIYYEGDACENVAPWLIAAVLGSFFTLLTVSVLVGRRIQEIRRKKRRRMRRARRKDMDGAAADVERLFPERRLPRTHQAIHVPRRKANAQDDKDKKKD